MKMKMDFLLNKLGAAIHRETYASDPWHLRLINACVRDNVSEIQKCIDEGHSVCSNFENTKTLIIAAALFTHFNFAKDLIDRLAAVTDLNESIPLCLLGTAGNSYEITKYLLEKGLNPNTRSIEGMTPLKRALNGSGIEPTKIIKCLIEHGADVNQVVAGVTPLMEISNKKNLGSVKLLVEAGADVNAMNRLAYLSILDLHFQEDDFEVAYYLIGKGAHKCTRHGPRRLLDRCKLYATLVSHVHASDVVRFIRSF